jgi:hypothetical protein
MIIREKVMARIEEVLVDLPLANTWDDVFDVGISKGTTNWQLCGSRKPANDVYKLVQCYNVQIDPDDGEFMFKSVDTKKYYNEDEFFKLSVRNNEIPFFFPTKKLQDLLPSKNDIKERTSSPDSTPTIITDIDNKYNKMIFELALEQGILDPRSANRFDWLNMGWMLKN